MGESSRHKRYIMQPDDLNIIVEMCKLMNTAMRYEMLLQTIIDYCTRVMKVEGASVLLYDEKLDKLTFHAATGSKSETLKKVVLNTDEGIAGWVFKHKESIYSNDPEDDARFSARVDKFTRFTTQSVMATPLLLENSVIGVFELVNKNEPGGFTERDLVLCEGMAAHVALAVERVHLISENVSFSRLAAIGETVAGLAHYIKNILTGLEGGAHLIRAALKENDHATVEKVWPMAERNIDRISMLSMDMLEFSKKREPYYTLQSITGILNEVTQLFEERAKTANAKIETDYDSSIPDCYFDAQRMHRCLLNLVANSFDACKKISNPIIRLAVRQPDAKTIRIEVADNGSGMTQEIIDKILMSKFFSTKGSQGTGLGIPVVRKIIQEHNGTLEIHSEPGKGSTFIVALPLYLENPFAASQ